ncbi:hypothetical protein GCM10009122_47570 [Fulvivirga kasyanovii]|uniref:hypothetical protein n=1 Tax=Fulvivirga kasyanovii TaxID=396812 RepID=UPI0031E0B09F
MKQYFIRYRLKQNGTWQYEQTSLSANGPSAAESVLILQLLQKGKQAEEFEILYIIDTTEKSEEKIKNITDTWSKHFN